MELTCHCGNIRLKVEHAPETLTTCTCSVCHRYGAQWGYFMPNQVEVTEGSKPAVPYHWGDKYLEFMHCPQCGCLTHYVTTAKASEPKVGVNFRMAPRLETRSILIRQFDGADTWKYLDD